MIVSGGGLERPIPKKAQETDEEKYVRLVTDWKLLNNRFDKIKYIRSAERQSVRAKLESLHAQLMNLARKIERSRARQQWLQSRTSQHSTQTKVDSDESPALTNEISNSS